MIDAEPLEQRRRAIPGLEMDQGGGRIVFGGRPNGGIRHDLGKPSEVHDRCFEVAAVTCLFAELVDRCGNPLLDVPIRGNGGRR